MRGLAIVLAVVALAAGCSNEAGIEERFQAMIEDGSGCPALFGVRNKADPKSAVVKRMNTQLALIGCSFSQAERIDLGPGSEGPGSRTAFDLDQMRTSWDHCHYTRDQLFAEAGTDDPIVAADWYGEVYREPYRTPSIAGCLAGITGEPRP